MLLRSDDKIPARISASNAHAIGRICGRSAWVTERQSTNSEISVSIPDLCVLRKWIDQ